MKKILIFDFFSGNIAGAQKVTFNVIRMLEDNFILSIFNRPVKKSEHGRRLREKFNVNDIPCDRLISSVFGTGNFETSKKSILTILLFFANIFILNVFSLLKVISEKPDYVYTYDPRGFILSFLFLRFFKTKKIWHLHGPLHCHKTIARALIYFTDVVIVPSKAIKDSLPKSNKVTVIYNGFNFKDEERSPNKTGTLNLIFVGTIAPHKGLHNLIESLSYVNIVNIKDNICLDIYGEENSTSSYPFSYRQLLEKKIPSRKNIKVNFMGWSDQISNRLAQADLLIFPSVINQELTIEGNTFNIRSSEALPTVIIESISVGTPVIATNTPGVDEIITEYSDGIIITESDPTLISNAINEYLKNAKTYSPDTIRIREKFSEKIMKDSLFYILKACHEKV